jgi:replication factor C subunit 2/4
VCVCVCSRPADVASIAHQTEVVSALTACIREKNVPHFLFYGPPGTGKTTAALAVAHQLFGKGHVRDRVLELNASDDRGIAAVRTKVKTFASTVASGGGSAAQGGVSLPPFKIIILDEADAMTGDAQSALRRVMETYSKSTRFFLLCNYISRIIEPVASRCAKFRFLPVESATMISRLRFICAEERVTIDDDALQELVTVSRGDMRKAITLLQSAARLGSGNVQLQHVRDLSGLVPAPLFDSLLQSCFSGSVDLIERAVLGVLRRGYPASSLLFQLHAVVLGHAALRSDRARAEAALILSEADAALTDGCDEYLQLMSVFCGLQKLAV